ncbi:MAG: DUF4783 domain-containing protein [Flavobacteriales bacterium]|jgi:hypothetical protein
MKHVLAIFLSAFALIGVAQTDITPQVSDALKKGDANALSAFFMSTVEIELKEESNTYSSADAKSVMTTFFSQNPVKGFTIKHQGTSKLDDQYRIGDLVTAKGNYRVTFFMKKVGNGWQIKQLKIEG